MRPYQESGFPPEDPSVSEEEIFRRRMEWVAATTTERNAYLSSVGAIFTCPCCGHGTLAERGVYEICIECGWEDDGQDDHDSHVVNHGPNGLLSLDDARAEYIRDGGTPQPHRPPARPV